MIPVHDVLSDHPSLRCFPQPRAAMAALFANVGALRTPPFQPNFLAGRPDILDWLGAFFGFQADNIHNQREHLVLLLANAQLRLSPQPAAHDTLDPSVPRRLRRKLLDNYESWCAFLGRKSSVLPVRDYNNSSSLDIGNTRDLLYVSLYLLIWGEAANLRFMPEFLCYVFHFMAMELNHILEGRVDRETGQPMLPKVSGENAFLNRVVKPVYDVARREVMESKDGTKPHSAWRNYDDLNEYFWRRGVFEWLGWPMELSKGFFVEPGKPGRVGKTGFVEQRSFWNVYRSFDRLWVMLLLCLQASMIVAWEGDGTPWKNLQSRDVQMRVLSIFITWAGLRVLQSVLDAGTQYSLASRDSPFLVVRMVLKILVAAGWVIVFAVLYSQMWYQRWHDHRWSAAAYAKTLNFLKAAAVFSIPQVLAVVLFIIPLVRIGLEKFNLRILYVLTWWFQTRTFVGRGVREGLIDNFKYSMFWVLLLIAKFSFSYFLQIRPMVAPTKTIYNLRTIEHRWHEFFPYTNRFAVVILWLPVIMVYLMDIQIWYAIFSSLVGAFVGLFSHLGEIRSVNQLRLRFQFFASAMQFNLMPSQEPYKVRGTLQSKLSDAINRLKLRYGFGRPYRKFDANEIETMRFALIWNEIIGTFREEDIISDHEYELLELSPEVWNIRVVRWPCVLLGNELLLALGQAEEPIASDKIHWGKIRKNEYRRCAVIEAYDSVRYLLLRILKQDSEEYRILQRLFDSFDEAMELGEFTAKYKTSVLPSLHSTLITLLEQLRKPEKDLMKVINIMQTLYDIAIRDFPTDKKGIEDLKREGLTPMRRSNTSLLFERAIELPKVDDLLFYRQLRRLHTILTARDSMDNIPRNPEARRRIAFFSNSLFMNMPRAPQVEKMMAFSVLTPYYNEDVVYSKEQLRTENEDGISIMFYLQKIYEDDWANFLERMQREGMTSEDDIWDQRLRELRLWASYRGQTLSRTVRGMMYYHRALKMLAFLDSASEVDIRDGTRNLASLFPSRHVSNGQMMNVTSAQSVQGLSRARSSVSLLFSGNEDGAVLMKYIYVVTCQIYGNQKAKKDPRADEILYLMKNNEALRVAYVDEVEVGRDDKRYYSVLVKYDQELDREVEVYRIQLPGPLKLGEGKPENQNHAIIFTRGDAVQTIDMNQDNYFEEALKMRNLLEEYNYYRGIRKPTLLGVRENVFTGSVSSLAWFMSLQENSFVTLGQRVLANPLKVRMHYGHPDVFDRIWFLSRGGISKASRVINISEDIFAGFNCTLRGGNVTHHEYIQVGKGRDVGLNQISMFEAKVASGNGEQTLSRDVYRLGHRLDFFRMLSVFFTTVGFYFNAMMVVLTIYAFVWGRLYLALSGLEETFRKNAANTNNASLGAILNQQFLIQMGLFTALPMIIENSIELGFFRAVWDFLKMQFQLSSVFYSFSLGTKAYYYGRTILHGGAKYRATGRGFVVEHKSFGEIYRLYARSHFIKAIELGVLLTMYASHSIISKNALVYIVMMLSSWFLVVSWIMAPFAFNPSGFDWLKTVYDFEDFKNWIWYRGGVFAKSDQSWEVWWSEEMDHLKTTGFWGRTLEILLDLRYFFFQYGIVYQLRIANGSTSIAVYLISWVFVIVAFGVFAFMSYARDRYAAKKHEYYRAAQAFVIFLVVLVLVLLKKFTKFQFIDIFTSFLAFLPTGWGLISIALVMKRLLESAGVWDTVVEVARLYEIVLAVIIMAPLALLSWMPGFQEMQTRILFNEGFSRGLQISRILAGKKPNTA